MKIVYRNNKQENSIALAKKKDRKGQQQLFERYAPKMLSICRYYVGNQESAEEVLLNGFLKAFLKIDQYQNKGSFEGWLRKIMIHEALSFLRKRKELEINYFEDLLYEPQPELRFDGITEEEIHRIIDRLPTDYKTVFLLFVVEGYSHSEISKAMTIPENTSKSHLLRARKIMQQQLLKHYQLKKSNVKN